MTWVIELLAWSSRHHRRYHLYLSNTHTHTLSFSNTHSLSHTHSLSNTHTHTHTFSLSLILSHSSFIIFEEIELIKPLMLREWILKGASEREILIKIVFSQMKSHFSQFLIFKTIDDVSFESFSTTKVRKKTTIFYTWSTKFFLFLSLFLNAVHLSLHIFTQNQWWVLPTFLLEPLNLCYFFMQSIMYPR